MHKALYIPVLLMIFCVFGCTHNRVTSTVNVSIRGAQIKTLNRYSLNKVDARAKTVAADLESYQPEVFAADGIPISLNASNLVGSVAGRWSMILPAMTIGVLPWVVTTHSHKKYTISFESDSIPERSFETCTRRGEAFAWLPFPLLFFNWEPTLCFNSGKVWSLSNYEMDHPDHGPEREAVAYGIASKLKELEDAGFVSLDVRARQWAKKSVDGGASGEVLSNFGEDPSPVPFKIDKLVCDAKRDFSYTFELSKNGGGKVLVSDYGAIRSAFMTAIRTHYANEHKDVNPRTLVVDFPKYVVTGNRISGVAVILSVSPQSVFYDSTTHKGRLVAKIGQNQFEDVRRWMRKNIESIARKSNIVKEGDDIPVHAQFYIGREQLGENGIFELEFKTE